MIAELQSALKDKDLSKAELIRAQVVLMRKKGLKRSLIAEVVGKSLSVVEDWITSYTHHGLDGLRTKKRAVPARAYLTPTQRASLCKLLNKKPHTLGIGIENYWTMITVKQLVERETGVVYKSLNSYRKLLDKAKLSYQKVEFVDHHQNSTSHDGFQKQFEAKIKGGAITMSW